MSEQRPGCVADLLGELAAKKGAVCRCAACKADRAAKGIPEPADSPCEQKPKAMEQEQKKAFSEPTRDRIKEAAGDRED